MGAMLDGSSIDEGSMENSDKVALTGLAAVVAVVVGSFIKGAWGDVQKQAEEAANPHVRWTDAARWEK
jgi:hypothetical protein